MTEAEAIAQAKAIANDRRWPWRDPIYVVSRRRGLLQLGRPYWDITSNARANGDNVRIAFDERTGRAFRCRFIASGAADGPAVTEFRALEIAREVAESSGWRWEQPIRIQRVRHDWKRGKPWWVWSNANNRGRNVSVLIDAQSGAVLNSGFAPR